MLVTSKNTPLILSNFLKTLEKIIIQNHLKMTGFEETDELPDREKAREFYSKYEPKEVLGKGISSVVRKCIEKSTNKEYAVKIVEYNNNDIKESTLREIEIMKLIGGHPNISKLKKKQPAKV